VQEASYADTEKANDPKRFEDTRKALKDKGGLVRNPNQETNSQKIERLKKEEEEKKKQRR
jgi:hypothetical protein